MERKEEGGSEEMEEEGALSDTATAGGLPLSGQHAAVLSLHGRPPQLGKRLKGGTGSSSPAATRGGGGNCMARRRRREKKKTLACLPIPANPRSTTERPSLFPFRKPFSPFPSSLEALSSSSFSLSPLGSPGGRGALSLLCGGGRHWRRRAFSSVSSGRKVLRAPPRRLLLLLVVLAALAQWSVELKTMEEERRGPTAVSHGRSGEGGGGSFPPLVGEGE